MPGSPTPTLENTVLVISAPKGVIPNRAASAAPAQDLAQIARFFESLAIGCPPGSSSVDVHRGSTNAAPVAAAGTVTLAGGVDGDTTVTINGVGIVIGAEADDDTTAAAIAAAVSAEADPLVAGLVSATSDGAVVTITALQKGKVGNAFTLASSTAGAGTATASGARLTGGVGGDSTAVRTFKG